jgi:hypothetical protein
MKTLVESIFGDNVTNNPNVTTVQDAEKVVVDTLERCLKMKCLDIAESSQFFPQLKQSMIWKNGKWALAMCPMDEDSQNVSTNIYLQYNLDWPRYIKPEEKTKIETSNFSIRILIRISPWRNDQIILKEIGVEVYEGFGYESGTEILDTSISHHTRLKDIIFNTNTLGIVKFLGECFLKFKMYVENDVFNEVFRHLYAKQTTKGQTSRKHDNLAAQELSRVFNTIVK